MSIQNLKACIKVAACICAKDGVISEAEETKLFQILNAEFPDFNVELFENTLTDFFNSDDQIEDYLGLMDDKSLRLFTLKLAEISAGADGLDTRENIALQKAYIIWEVTRNV